MNSELTLVWPADELILDGTTQKYFSPKLSNGCRKTFAVGIWRVGDFEAMHGEWLSPFTQMWRWPTSADTSRRLGRVRFVPKCGGAEPFLVVCAKRAFFDLPQTSIVEICNKTGAPTRAGSLYELLEGLIRQVLGCTAAEATEILHLRCIDDMTKACDVEVDQVEDAMEVLANDDRRDISQRIKQLKSRKAERKTFRGEWAARRRSVGSTRSGASGSSHPHPPFADPGYKYLHLVPKGAIEQTDAKLLLPPGASIWRAWKAGAWCGHLRPHSRISATWTAHSHRGAAMQVLQSLWRLHLADHNLSESQCPIRGMFGSGDDLLGRFANGSAPSASAGPQSSSAAEAPAAAPTGRRKRAPASAPSAKAEAPKRRKK